jgi:protein TonB
MSDKHIEKSLLLLTVFSLLLHVAGFVIISKLPQPKSTIQPEPYMVELRDLPELKQQLPTDTSKSERLADRKMRVDRETAPKGEQESDRIAPQPSAANRQQPQPEERIPVRPPLKGDMNWREKPPEGTAPKIQKLPGIEKLFPSAGKMANLEESYRKKYGPEVEEGNTKFLNTDDMLFGSFLRHFETAVYGVWRYPQEAVRLGIEGITPVKITFNRKGEIQHIELLESSGSRILDEEVIRTLKQIGPVGYFPKSYGKDVFNLIAFFRYGITSGGVRGTLY